MRDATAARQDLSHRCRNNEQCQRVSRFFAQKAVLKKDILRKGVFLA
jgi:hypothetical protein